MSGQKQCSYCDRSFARSEHLSRHERSHRNERPYRCTSCSATFTRKDVFRRHHSRHHGQPVEVAPQQHAQGGSKVDPPISLQSRLTPASSHGAASVTARDGIESSTATATVFDPTDLFLMNSPIMDSLISALDFPAISGSDLFSNLTGRAHENPLGDLASSCLASLVESAPVTACPPQVMESPVWKGSFAISEQKRGQLASEIDPTEDFSDFAFPSRFTLERLLNTCAECFLIYIPCIHTPTWKAELAPPCMIFAMASIGASYHDDNMTATSLHRIATAGIKKYLALSPLTIADEPLWVLQCLLLIMVNGTKSASFRTFQEAASLTSLLIEGIRYRKFSPCLPGLEGGEIDLLERWRKWIDFETTVRTTCAIYVYLGALGVTFQTANGPWNMDMSDCFLPCEETEWMSISPQAWLETRQSSFKPPIRFSAAMASLFSSQWAPPLRLSTFGSYVTLHGIVKQLATLYQDIWLLAATPTLVQRFEQALAGWRMCSEQNPEFHCSPRYPSGVVAANALSLYRQAHVRLCGNFGPLRSAFATRNLQTILSSIEDIKIVISSSSTCVRAARCALEALQTSVRMGMSLTGSISGWHHKLLFNLYSLECCLFQSFWIREQSNRSRSDRSSEENDIVRSTQETLAEINLDPILASKPCSIQLIYAWSLVFQNCNASGLYGIVAEVLKIYADGLTE